MVETEESADVRIVVVSPPRSGNHWIECLLGSIYDLEEFGGARKPDATKPRAFRDWAANGGFPDGTMFHLHCRYKAEFCDAIEAVPANVVTIVRDPYDAFVSRYYWTQERNPPNQEKAERRPRSADGGQTAR